MDSSNPTRVVIIEDSENDFQLLERHLLKGLAPVACAQVRDYRALEEALASGCDAVLADYNLPGMDFSRVLGLVRERLPEVPIILISGTITDEQAAGMLSLGLNDFVLKGNLVRLAPSLRRALEEAAGRRARRRAEQALREREARLREAQRLGGLGSWEWRPDTDRVFWSEELYHITGLDPAADAPNFYQGHRSLLTEESMARLQPLVEAALRDGEPYAVDLEIVRADGEHRWITVRGEPLRGESGDLEGLRGTALDITRFKRMERELRHRNRELETFNQSMLGRELAMIDLKRQVNDLSAELGREPVYPLDFVESGDDSE